MVTSVLIEDFPSSSANFTIIGDDEMLTAMDFWDKEDSLLQGLSHLSQFKGCEIWSDLRPWHWTFLITDNIEKLMALPKNKRNDPDHPVNQSLDIMLSGLILCMREKADMRAEFIKIQRIGPHNVNFDYQGSIMLEVVKSQAKHGLAVVVDNTNVEPTSEDDKDS